MDESNSSHNLSSNSTDKKPSFDAHKGLIVAIGLLLVILGAATFFQHKFDFIAKLPIFSRNVSKDVLAAYDIVPYTQLQSNLKYVFNNSAEVLNGMRIRGDVDADGSNVTLGEGTIIASNIIYSLIAGDGITISPGQNPTISVTNPTSSGVTSIEDISGEVDLIAGSNISLSTDGNKITINSTASGADGNTTYSAGEGLALTGTTFSVDYNGIGLSDLGTSNTTSGASVIGVYSGNFTNIMVASPGTDLQTVLEAIDAELTTSGGGGISAVGNIANGNAFTSGVPGSNLFIADTGWIGIGGAAGRIYFDDNGTDTISFMNAFVGIGTSSPQYTLDVAGNIRAGTEIYRGSVALGGTGGASVLGVDSSSITYSSATNIQQALEDLDAAINNFGVGGSGPWLISGNYAYLNPSLATYLGNNASGGTNKISGAYFSDGSLVSLGTDNDYRLVFDGNNLLLGDTSNTFLSVGDSGTTGNFNFNNNQFYIRGDGNIGVGTTAPGYRVDIAGGIRVGGTAVFSTVPSISDNNSVLTLSSGVLSSIDSTNWDKNGSDDLSSTTVFLGDVSGPYNNLQINPNTVDSTELVNTAVSVGSYGGVGGTAIYVPSFTVDADGRLTAASTTPFIAGTNFESPLTFTNGLTRTGNSIAFGGTLSGNTNLTLGSNNFTMMGAGSVGIGTTSIASGIKLDVAGNIRAGTDVYIGSIALGGTGGASVIGFNDLNNGLIHVDAATIQNAIEDLDATFASYQSGTEPWLDQGDYLYPRGDEYLGDDTSGSTDKLNGIFLLDAGGVTFGQDNDFYMAYHTGAFRLDDNNLNTLLSVGDSGTTGNFNFNNGQFYIRGDGNIGVGTTGPNDVLDVVGAVDASTFYKIGDNKVLDVENTGTLLVGISAGYNLIAGADYNTLIGYQSGQKLNSSGADRNVFVGAFVGQTATSAFDNVFIGSQAGYNLENGYYNTVIGRNAGFDITTGYQNTFIGEGAGDDIATGHSNTLIGAGAGGTSDLNNSIVLSNGNGADATADNQLVIGGNFNNSQITDGYFGSGVVDNTPFDFTFNATGGNQASDNIYGANLIFAGGKATGNADGGDIIFKTSDVLASGTGAQSLTEKMRLTDEGFLGIGTTTPQYTLDVAGSIRAGTEIYRGSVALGDTGGANVLGFNDLNNTLTYVDASTIQNAIEDLDSAMATLSGSAGLWTDAGAFLFPTGGDYLGNIAVGGTGKLSGAYFSDGSLLSLGTDNDYRLLFNGSDFILGDTSNTFLSIGDSGTTGNFNFNNNQLYLRGDGNVGIGTTSPNDALDVAGVIDASSYYELGNNKILDIENNGSLMVGIQAGNTLPVGADYNTLVGYQAGYAINNTNADNNTLVGAFSGSAITSGFENTIIGSNSGLTLTSGFGNTLLGEYTGVGSTSSYNLILGKSAGTSNNSGNYNVMLGAYAQVSSHGHHSILIGGDANTSFSSAIGIGYNADPTAANQLVIGGNDADGFINDAYFGRGVVSSTPNDITLNATGGSGSNISGANFRLAGGKGTGNGDGGDLVFLTSDSGPSSSTLQSLTEKMRLTDEGNLGLGTTNPAYKLDVSGTARAWDLISQNIILSSLSTNIINAFGGFDGYTNFTGGIGTGGIGKDSITGAQRLTADGNLTNIGTYQGGEMHLSSGGTFATKVDYTSGTEPFGLAIGDINGDNVLDVISANVTGDSISVFINNGNGTLATKVDYAATNGPYTPEIGDLNGDGIADLAVINSSSDFLSVYINNGDGTFATEVEYAAAGGQSRGLSIGDVNGDGKNDLVVASGDADVVSIYLNNGNGTFATKVDYATGDFPNSVSLGDVDGDSKLDIVTANYFGHTMSVLINNGNGTFATKVDYATGLTAYDSVIADFDGDRNPDVAISNYSSDTISVFINDGDGTFAAKVDYATGSVPNRLATADVNGDGYPDIAVTNRDGNSVSVYINDGDGTFAAKVDYATATGPTGIKLGDLNGDGKSDIATANWSSNTVSVLLNNVSTMLYAQASTGRVGIGTTAPTANMTLDVAGNIRAGTDIYIGSIALGSTGGAGLIGVNTAGFTFTTAPTVQGQLTALNTGIGSTAYSSTNYVTAGTSLGTSIGTLDSAIRNLAIGNSGLWRDTNGATAGGNVYLGDTTSNFAIGGTNSNAPFYVSPVLGASINVGSTAAFTIGNTASDIFTFNTDINSSIDLFSLNVPSGTSNIANLFAIYDNGSPIFSVSQSQIESAVPHVFSAAGDVSIAYDLLFSNETSSNIKTNGPFTIESGEVFENNDLTLRTFGTGDILLEPGSSGNLKVAGGSIIGGTYNSLGMTSPLNGLLVEGRVAIGATAPTANMALDVVGNIRAGTDVYIGSIRLGATGTTNQTSGAGKIGLYNEFSYIGVGSSTVQDGLDDLDAAIGNLVIGSSGLWLDGGNYTYLNTTYTGGIIGNTVPGGANKISGLFLTDTAPVWFGLDNDFKMQFNTTNLSIGDSSNNFLTIADSGTLGTLTFNTDDFYVSGTNSRVGIGTATPLGVLDVRGDIFTDRWLLSATNTGVGSSVYGGGALSHTTANEGWYNTAFGANALYSNTTGFMNTAIGQQAGYQNTTGDSNIAIGHQSLVFNQSGDKNVAIGVLAGYGVSSNSSSDNTLLGYSTGYSLTSSTGRNTLIGSQAGDQITSGTGNIVIGYNIDAPSATGNNQLNIGGLLMGTLGVGATINGNAVLGSSGSSAHTILGTVTAATIYNTTVGVTNRDLFVDSTGVIGYVSSSQRYKEEINYLNDVDWLYNLKPVNYVYKNDSTKALQYGLIAEEVNEINPLLVSYNDQGLPETVTYSKLITPLLKAVQDQRSTLTSLSNDFATLALPDVDSFVNVNEFDGLESEFNKLEQTQTAQQSEIIEIQSQVQDLMNRVELTQSVASEESKIDNLTDRVSFLEQMLFGKEASSSAELAELINNTNEYPDGEVLGIEDGKLTVEDLTVTGKTNLFDLGVVGDMSVGQIVVRGNEAAINSLGLPLEIQSEATAPIQLMAGKVVIDTDGNVIVKKEVTAKKYNVDTTDKEAASIGKGSIKIGETEVIIKSTSVTGNSNIFLTPTVETDVPLAVVEKIAGNYFKVKIVKEAEEDISFNWWIVN